MDFSKFEFKFGKAFPNANTYVFVDENKNELRISQKVGKFQDGDTSRYLKFDFNIAGDEVTSYIDRKSNEYKELHNIASIIENYAGEIDVCKGCNTIVLSSELRSSNKDKCVYCDKYVCKKCRRMFTINELDENRLCSKCKKEQENNA